MKPLLPLKDEHSIVSFPLTEEHKRNPLYSLPSYDGSDSFYFSREYYSYFSFFKRSPSEYLSLVSRQGYLLRTVPPRDRTFKICFAAVAQDGWALQYVFPFQRITKMCLIAVTQSGRSLDFVPNKLRTPEICLAAVTQNGRSLTIVPYKLRTPKICLAAIRQNPDAQEFSPYSILELLSLA